MAIGIHTHVVAANFAKSVCSEVAGWPSVETAHECHRNIIIDGKLCRTLSDRCWDAAGRLADMDQTGVSLQGTHRTHLPCPRGRELTNQVLTKNARRFLKLEGEMS